MPIDMTLSPRKQVVMAFYQEIWSKADVSLVARLMHADVAFHGALGQEAAGRAAIADHVRSVTAALGGFACDVDHLVEDGDHIAARLKCRGTHRGIFLGFAPTGEHLDWACSAHFTFRGPCIADVWEIGDLHGLIRQLQRQAGGIRR